MIALYPGAFKPPHRGHFEVVKSLLNGSHGGQVYTKDNYKDAGTSSLSGKKGKVEKINKVLVFPGGGERNGITKAESEAIWKIYAKYLPGLEVLDGEKNPMFAAKEYAKANTKDNFYAITGIRSEEDLIDLRRITTFTNTPHVEGLVIPPKGNGVRASQLRKAALSGNLDDLRDFFPDEINPNELMSILKMLKDNIISEIMNEKMEVLFEAMFSTNEDNRYNDDGYEEGNIKLMGDHILPIDKMVVLQAEEDTYNRGLLVTNNKDKSYDVAYWADDKTKPYPIGIEIDGKEVSKDAKIIKFMFHPEMKETANPQDGKAAPYGSGFKKVEESTNISNLQNYLGRLIPQGTTIKRDSDKLVVEYKNIKEAKEDTPDYTKYIGSILEYMLDQKMNIQPLPEVKVRYDEENADNFFGRTAYYDPNDKEIVLYAQGRHPKDIVRSFTHEMIHHIQNIEGRLGNINTSNTNDNEHLLEIEKEAYLQGNITFRNWEDQYKNGLKEEVMAEGKYDSITTYLTGKSIDAVKNALSKKLHHYKEGHFGDTSTEESQVRMKKVVDGVYPIAIISLPEDIDKKFQKESDLEFDFEIKAIFVKGVNTIMRNGGAYKGGIQKDDSYITPKIELEFVLDPYNFPGDFEELSAQISDVLRHEIEHLTQSGGNERGKSFGKGEQFGGEFGTKQEKVFRTKIERGIIKNGTSYLLLPSEIDANIQGMYLSAKKAKRPFKDVVDQYLYGFTDQFDASGNPYLTKQDVEDVKKVWSKRLPSLGIKQEL
jgi:hypothetical protein